MPGRDSMAAWILANNLSSRAAARWWTEPSFANVDLALACRIIGLCVIAAGRAGSSLLDRSVLYYSTTCSIVPKRDIIMVVIIGCEILRPFLRTSDFFLNVRCYS